MSEQELTRKIESLEAKLQESADSQEISGPASMRSNIFQSPKMKRKMKSLERFIGIRLYIMGKN